MTEIDKARAEFIERAARQGATYVGPVLVSEIDTKGLEAMEQRLSGKERLVEFHAFEVRRIPMIMQWRLV